MLWKKDEDYWFNKRFKLAKDLVKDVKFLYNTPKREYYKVGEVEVTLNKNLIDIGCTCKECSVFPYKLCENKLSVLAFKIMQGIKNE